MTQLYDWDEYVRYYAFAYNTTPTTTHGYTPFELVFGRKANLPTDLGQTVDPRYNLDSYVTEVKFKMQTVHKLAQDTLIKLKQKTISDQNNARPIEVAIGDRVKLTNSARENKFSPIYLGPSTISKLLDTNVEIIDDKGKKQVVHKNRISKF